MIDGKPRGLIPGHTGLGIRIHGVALKGDGGDPSGAPAVVRRMSTRAGTSTQPTGCADEPASATLG